MEHQVLASGSTKISPDGGVTSELCPAIGEDPVRTHFRLFGIDGLYIRDDPVVFSIFKSDDLVAG